MTFKNYLKELIFGHRFKMEDVRNSGEARCVYCNGKLNEIYKRKNL